MIGVFRGFLQIIKLQIVKQPVVFGEYHQKFIKLIEKLEKKSLLINTKCFLLNKHIEYTDKILNFSLFQFSNHVFHSSKN